MAAGFGALRDDDRSAGVERLRDVAHGLRLADDGNAGVARLVRERRRIAEGEKETDGAARDRPLDELRRFLRRPGNEADADRRVAGRAVLLLEVARAAISTGVAAAENAETAGMGHRGGELAAGDVAHRRADDR